MEELQKQIAQANDRDLRQMKALLVSQALTLDTIFGRLMRAGLPAEGSRCPIAKFC